VAQNEINIKLKVSDDGGIELVANKADKAAASTEKLTKSRDGYMRKEKGVAVATSNTTKAFSKMQQGMGGLVPAYATLAANVFALSAVFGVLRRAAQVEQLEQGLVTMGQASGLAMNTLAEGLQRATGHALSLEEAMRSTAMITSAGLDPSMIEEFGEAAKNASIALGRNTQDSLERFTRGVTKLEPELLDELGIFVKLDEAYEQYAIKLDKNVNQLTSFEKRQAFANATLDEANTKFGALSDVDANPFDQLAAAFADLSKQVLKVTNVAIVPFIQFLTENTVLLGAAALAFASTISSRVIGSIADFSESSAEAAKQQVASQSVFSDSLDSYNNQSDTLSNLSEKLRDNTATNEDFEKAVSGQNRSLKLTNTLLEKGTITQEEATRRTNNANKALTQIRASQLTYARAASRTAEANTLQAFSQGRLADGFRLLKIQISTYGKQADIAKLQTSGLSRALGILRIGMGATAAAARMLGAAMSFALGPVSIFISTAYMLYEAFQFVFESLKSDELKAYEKQTKATSSAVEELATNLREVERFHEGTSKVITDTTSATISLGNIARQTLQQMDKFQQSEMGGLASKGQIETINKLLKKSPALRDALGGITEVNHTNLARVRVELERMGASGGAVQSLKEAFKNAGDEMTKFFNTFEKKTPVDSLLESVRSLSSAFDDVQGQENAAELIQDRVKSNAQLTKLLGDGENITRESLDDIIGILDAEQQRNREVQQQLATKKEQIRAAKAGGMLTEEGLRTQLALEEELLRIQVDSLYQESLALKTLATATKDEEQRKALKDQAELLRQQSVATEAQILDFNGKQLAIEQNKLKNFKAQQGVLKFINGINERLANSSREQVEAEIKKARALAESLAAEEGRELSDKEILMLEKGAIARREKVEKQVLESKKKGINLEFDLLKAQFALEQAKLDNLLARKIIDEKAHRDLTAQLNAAQGLLADARLSALDAATSASAATVAGQQAGVDTAETGMNIAALEAGIELRQQMIELQRESGRVLTANSRQQALNLEEILRLEGLNKAERDEDKRIERLMKINELTQDNINLEKERIGLYTDRTVGYFGGPDSPGGVAAGVSGRLYEDASDPTGVLATGTAQEKMQLINEEMAPFFENLKELGPDGAIISASMEGAMLMGTAFADVFADLEDGGLRVSTAINTIGATITAVAGMQKAQSDRAIANVDREIAAEKKRDGKSKESLARIKALEAKKEAMKRKAFEKDKKMRMAQIIMGTAGAIVNAMNTQPFIPAGLIAAAIAGAMGAAQLAAVASSSYEGGGGGASTGNVPQSISVGNRKNTVDLARTRGAAGERSYFLGNRGVGGPETFRPAFTGMKYRANGGNAAFMVGEQGPEMFVPETPGTVVPSDETPTTAPINANINISAVDAAGVEELLVNQRGNIIGMLREAANAGGETFLESVSIQELT
tara:strand:+ start:792 stop:5090 length:4299 start_codon:yes stop_codon:yes gene_type:complete